MAQPTAWILGEGFGLVPEDQNQEEGKGEGVTKTGRKTREWE